MILSVESSLIKLTNAGLHLSEEFNLQDFIRIIVEESMELSCCDLSSLYICEDPDKNNCNLDLVFKKGKYDIRKEFKYDNILIDFLKENKESTILLERKKNIFIDLLLNQKMQSGIALPLIKEDFFLGVLILNSKLPYNFNREKIDILDSFIKLVMSFFKYTGLVNDLKAYLKKIKY